MLVWSIPNCAVTSAFHLFLLQMISCPLFTTEGGILIVVVVLSVRLNLKHVVNHRMCFM